MTCHPTSKGLAPCPLTTLPPTTPMWRPSPTTTPSPSLPQVTLSPSSAVYIFFTFPSLELIFHVPTEISLTKHPPLWAFIIFTKMMIMNDIQQLATINNIGMIQYSTKCFPSSLFTLQSYYSLPLFLSVSGHIMKCYILHIFTSPSVIFLKNFCTCKSFISEQVTFYVI